MRYPILVLASLPAGGKSTLARELCDRFPRGVHIEMDFLRNMVIKDFAPPRPPTEKSTLQDQIACANACTIARNYQRRDFFVVIDDAITSPDPYLDHLHAVPSFTLFLKPQLEISLQRNALRTNKDFDTSALTDTIKTFYKETEQDGFVHRWDNVLDNSHLNVAETAETIFLALKTRYPEIAPA